ncbi:hypothetical protein [Tumebacillus flagellatus]|uniref:Uncharacterized protein n=1 Tax=Tumebacillus flagellatus TaxID=1157490 RepID=A0A074LRZ1_9BACL|nr:hypothetical protein [Tumebacillus flagellatus]KEO83245.1 hypothetical protein EL26_11180 [Tumebacillus flagellatus]
MANTFRPRKARQLAPGNTFSETVFLYYLIRLYDQTKQNNDKPDIARYISEYPKVKTELEQSVLDRASYSKKLG